MADRIINVITGPIHSSEIPDWDEQEDGFGLPYNEGFMLVVQLQDERGVIKVEELIFEDFLEAMIVVDHFTDQIIPYEWSEEF